MNQECHDKNCSKASAGYRHIYCVKCKYTNYLPSCEQHFARVVIQRHCYCPDKVPFIKEEAARRPRRRRIIMRVDPKSASARISNGSASAPKINSPFFHSQNKKINRKTIMSPSIKEIKKEIEERIEPMPKEKILKNLKKLKTYFLNEHDSLSATLWIQTFIDAYDLYERKKDNCLHRGYDPVNDVFGADILYLCYEKTMKCAVFSHHLKKELAKIKPNHIREKRFSGLIVLLTDPRFE